MRKTSTITATAADFQELLTNEIGNTVKKSVLFYIDDCDPLGLVSPFEREMIAEKAFAHVVEKKAKFKPTGEAKFITWAKVVAERYASDELDKLKNDPLHLTGQLFEDQPKNEDDARKYSDTVSYRKAFGHVEDCTDRLHLRDALETLKRIVSNYSGRDRTVAEMLIAERTKPEIMAETQMSSGYVDVCISRIRKKMRSDLRGAGFDLFA